jgi:arsenate reductase
MNSLKPLNILFLSTGNAARSIMAEALVRHKGSDRFRARSAGFKPLHDVHPHTLTLLTAGGISTEGLHPKGWKEFLAAWNVVKCDVIVTLSEEARIGSPVWPDNPVRVHWPVDDPLSAEKTDVMEWKFRKCFHLLETRIALLIKSRIAQSPCELLLQMKDIGMVV